ncbi:hypothetical protein RN001_004312 [Aquatica leii]|uniref:Uncharacterized protein n=1 Tax=Aquatica leii TaxID=1421715 RepID=A0AAN7SPH6_9COLE|nr:hypothetical protein RN001_004312 [Aquatica leii]
MLLLFFLVSLIPVNNANKNITQLLHTEDNLNNFLIILKRYQVFSVVYYVDFDVLIKLDKILQINHNDFEQPCVIYHVNRSIVSSHRLELNRLVHVVLLKKPMNIQSFLMSLNISSEDVFLFVVTDQNWWKTKFWTMAKLDWAGNVLILNTTEHYMSLYKVCYYCEKPKELDNIYTGHFKDSLDVDINKLLPQNLQNFYGYNFKVGYLNSFPYMLCIEQTVVDYYTNCKKSVGLESEMLKLMSEKLNFTYLLIPFPYPSPNKSGSVNISVEYDFIIGAITICFKAIIEQVERVHLESINTQFSSHAILIFWWFASLIIATAYKSKLWAISIQNYNVEPTNLQQLLDSGYSIVVSKDNMEISESILNNGDPLTIAAQKKAIYKNDVCGGLAYVIDNKGAALNEYGILQYHSLLLCSYLLKPNVYLTLRLTSRPIHYTTHAWPLEKGAVYKNIFNAFIGRIQTSWYH